MSPPDRLRLTRRRAVALAGGAALAALSRTPLVRAAARPQWTHGVQSGDVDTRSGVAWVRTDRPARVALEWATTESFADPVRVGTLDAVPDADLVAKRLLDGLPPGQDVFWRALATDLHDVNAVSEPIVGRFRTAPLDRRTVRFAWSGDTVGQGWGIDEARGGMTTYRTILGHRPDFFLHSGDTIYADGPLEETVPLPDGTVWRNLVTPEKSKVAETLDEFRGQWKYNLLDRNVLALNAALPTFVQWDDHEVVDNWSPSKVLDDRYTERRVDVLAARSARAFAEMTPIRAVPGVPRVHRTIRYGPLLDVFFLDMRSFRGPNDAALGDGAALLGARQLAWLRGALAASRATWKVIAADMPLGLVVWDDWRARTGVEAVADGTAGAPVGREGEIAGLLSFLRREGIRNTVWLTADVHYTAAHHYSPDRAAFADFDPFWEFVSGPLSAGTFGPATLDATFGPEVRFSRAPTKEEGQGLSPAAGLQFFGLVEIDGATEALTVRLMDAADRELWRTTLAPERR